MVWGTWENYGFFSMVLPDLEAARKQRREPGAPVPLVCLALGRPPRHCFAIGARPMYSGRQKKNIHIYIWGEWSAYVDVEGRGGNEVVFCISPSIEEACLYIIFSGCVCISVYTYMPNMT